MFSGGVFDSKDLAEKWIEKHKLSGVLTKYPVNTGVFDWMLEEGEIGTRLEERVRKDPKGIGGFTSASMEHYHYEDGICEG